MKKFILAAAVVLGCAAMASAQESYAPEKGDFSVELQFNPFSDNFKTFQIENLQGRYFASDKDAVRFGIGFGVHNDKNIPDPKENDKTWDKTSTGHIAFNVGYERHFFSNGRVDLYAGAGVSYRHDFASAKGHSEFDGDKYEEISCNQAGEARVNNIFGVDVFTGIDFYVYKGLYVGAELGLSLKYNVMPGVYTKQTKNGSDLEGYPTDPVGKVTGFDFSSVCNPALRLGWTF